MTVTLSVRLATKLQQKLSESIFGINMMSKLVLGSSAFRMPRSSAAGYFTLNYLPNLFFIFFAFVIFILVIFAIVDALFGSQINSAISDIVVLIMKYGALFVIAISVIQWIYNFLQLNKAEINKEVKSKWRHNMFLWGFLANTDYYEEFIARKDDGQFKKVRDFLRLKSVSAFRP